MAIEISFIDILKAILVTATSFIMAVLVLVFIRRWLKKIAGKARTRLDDYAVMLFRGPVTASILFFAAIFTIRYLDTSFPGLLPEWLSLNLDAVTAAVGILVATSIVGLLFNKFLGSRVKRIIAESPESETIYQLVTRIIIILIYVVGGLFALSAVYPGISGTLTTLLFGAGFLAIVIGLAPQKVIGNVLSGINVAITRPVRLGDAVVIRGEFGFVEDIGLRHTVIRTWDNRRMIIPNSVLDEEVIINYTAKDPKKLFGITVGVPYDTG